MHFTCESCRATLHIADEKVKGKRLVVRCKRCGNKINIADPALSAAGAARIAQAAQKPAPAAAAPRAAEGDSGDDSDTESPRAMETAVLEEALRASKAAGEDAAAALKPLPPSAAPPSQPPRDPPIWFAMIGGKQVGPVSRAELGLKTAQGAVGPRTYIWREGMGAWQRAKDVGELSSLFAAPPEEQRPLPPPPVAAPPAPSSRPFGAPAARASAAGSGAREFSTQDFGDLHLDAVGNQGAAAARDFSAHELGDSPQAGSQDELFAGAKSKPTPQAPVKRATPAAVQPQKPSAPIVVNQHPEPKPEPKVRPLDISIEGFKPLKVDDGGDSTNVESLPLGERIHQEAVAKELFTTGQESGASAIDLARWASDELSRKEKQRGQVTSELQPLPQASKAVAKASAAAAEGRIADREPPETTGEVVARSGVQSSQRAVMLAAAAAAFVAVVVLLLYWLATTHTVAAPVKVEVAAPNRPALGGTGDSSVGGLLKSDKPPGSGKSAPAAPENALATRRASPVDGAGEGSDPRLTPEQEAAMKKLGNERGVGTHGPQAGAQDVQVAHADSGLSREDFDRVVAENKPAYTRCNDEARRRNPKMRSSKVQIALSIAPTGKVSDVNIDRREAQESPLGQCLIRATQRLVFPPFAGDPTPGVIPLFIAGAE